MRPDRLALLTLRVLALSFAAVGTLFWLAPDATLASLDATGALFGEFAPTPATGARLWLSLSVAYMLLVTLLAFAGPARSLACAAVSRVALRRQGRVVARSPARLSQRLTGLPLPRELRRRRRHRGRRGGDLAGRARPCAAARRRGRGSGRGLSRADARILRSALEALAPPGAVLTEKTAGPSVAAEVEDYVAAAGGLGAFRWLLRGLELSPFLLPPLWLRRFSSLALADRVRVARGLGGVAPVAAPPGHRDPQARGAHARLRPPRRAARDRLPGSARPRPARKALAGCAMTRRSGHRGDVEERAEVVVIGTGAGGAVVAAELAEAGIDVLLLEEGDHPERIPPDAPPLARIGALYRDGGMTGTLGNTFIPVPVGTDGRRHDRHQLGHLLARARAGAGALGARVRDSVARRRRPRGRVRARREGDRRRPRAGGAARPGRAARAARRRGPGPAHDAAPAQRHRVSRHRHLRLRLPARRQAVDQRLVRAARHPSRGAAAREHARRARAARGRPRGRRRRDPPRRARPADRHGCGRAPRASWWPPARCSRRGCWPRAASRRAAPRSASTCGCTPRRASPPSSTSPSAPGRACRRAFRSATSRPRASCCKASGCRPSCSRRRCRARAAEHEARMAAVARMASFGALISDTSEGRVRRLGARSLAWYRMNAEDVQRMRRAISLLARIYFAAGAREVYPGLRQAPVLRTASEAEALEQPAAAGLGLRADGVSSDGHGAHGRRSASAAPWTPPGACAASAECTWRMPACSRPRAGSTRSSRSWRSPRASRTASPNDVLAGAAPSVRARRDAAGLRERGARLVRARARARGAGAGARRGSALPAAAPARPRARHRRDARGDGRAAARAPAARGGSARAACAGARRAPAAARASAATRCSRACCFKEICRISPGFGMVLMATLGCGMTILARGSAELVERFALARAPLREDRGLGAHRARGRQRRLRRHAHHGRARRRRLAAARTQDASSATRPTPT